MMSPGTADRELCPRQQHEQQPHGNQHQAENYDQLAEIQHDNIILAIPEGTCCRSRLLAIGFWPRAQSNSLQRPAQNVS